MSARSMLHKINTNLSQDTNLKVNVLDHIQQSIAVSFY